MRSQVFLGNREVMELVTRTSPKSSPDSTMAATWNIGSGVRAFYLSEKSEIWIFHVDFSVFKSL